ncbi:hypothetical protein GCM10022271_15890 [Corallibacter vietnamensis]|uniref:SGNH/GDSL hydrolase family protein n=1 Tax=Corallibacter vietnamensis TaxID=904130 RepID=A0ABP7H9T4_9FLAO
MKKFVKHIIGMLFGFVVVSQLVAFTSLLCLKNGSFYKPSFLENSVAETDFDYIVLGSSTGLTTINTNVLDSVLPGKGINLSIDDTALSSQYVMLQHFLALGKKTKICVLSASVSDYDRLHNKLSSNDYRFLPYVFTNYVSAYYNEFPEQHAQLLALSKWVPMFGIGYYNTELFYPAIISLLKPNKHNRFDNAGNYTYPVRAIRDMHIINRKQVPVRFRNKYLARIQKLCDANDIKLICYLPPLQKEQATFVKSDYHVINHTGLLNNTKYFYDDIHVNIYGRQLASEKLAVELLSFF